MMKRYYIRDSRQQSVMTGKPSGGWLKKPPAPAEWVHRRELAQSFTADEIKTMKRLWHYIEGCEVIPANGSPLVEDAQ